MAFWLSLTSSIKFKLIRFYTRLDLPSPLIPSPPFPSPLLSSPLSLLSLSYNTLWVCYGLFRLKSALFSPLGGLELLPLLTSSFLSWPLPPPPSILTGSDYATEMEVPLGNLPLLTIMNLVYLPYVSVTQAHTSF